MNINFDVQLLNQNKCEWLDSNGINQIIVWKFIQYNNYKLPGYYFECKISGLGKSNVSGFSFDLNKESAILKSFCESWERLWYKIESHRASSTNGFAAGTSNEMAIQNSRNELIERAILTKAWSTQCGWQRVQIKKSKNKIIMLGLRAKGWRFSLFNIHSNLGILKAGFVIHPKLGSIFDATFGLKEIEAENKIINSMIRGILTRNASYTQGYGTSDSLLQHLEFYSNPQNNKAFDFLIKNENPNQETIVLDDLNQIQSTVVTPQTEMPAVVKSWNNRWSELKWGSDSIIGKNQWPQPLI